MFGLGKPARPKAVAFDIIGTVFPLEPLRPSVMALGLPAAGLEGWFAAGCRDAFAMAAAGDFKPFTTVLEAALDQVLAEQGLDPPEHDRKALVKGLETLDARSDAGAAFQTLVNAGIPLLALSNGAKSSTKSLLERAGIANLVQTVVSVDEVKLSKPRAEVYEHAAREASVATGELALVAVHPWDINGAAAAGLVTAYLEAERPYSQAMRPPDLTGRSLSELAERIADL